MATKIIAGEIPEQRSQNPRSVADDTIGYEHPSDDGRYDVSFGTGFGDTPAITITPYQGFAQITSVSTNGFSVHIVDSHRSEFGREDRNSGFHFIAVGPES